MQHLKTLFGFAIFIGSFILIWEVSKNPSINFWMKAVINIALIDFGWRFLPKSKEDKMNAFINEVGAETLLIHINDTLRKKKPVEQLHEEATKTLEETKA